MAVSGTPNQAEIDRLAKKLRDMPAMEFVDFRPLAVAEGALISPEWKEPDAAIQSLYMMFPNDGTISATEYLKEAKSKAAHCFIPPEIGDGIDPALLESAFGAHPTMKARGELTNLVGVDACNKLAAAWGVTGFLKPGKNPKAASANAAEIAAAAAARKPKSSNPWSKAGWNITAQGRLVSSLGDEKATAIAQAAGCKIGSTKPNPDFA
jgi:hypothetical protein